MSKNLIIYYSRKGQNYVNGSMLPSNQGLGIYVVEKPCKTGQTESSGKHCIFSPAVLLFLYLQGTLLSLLSIYSISP